MSANILRLLKYPCAAHFTRNITRKLYFPSGWCGLSVQPLSRPPLYSVLLHNSARQRARLPLQHTSHLQMTSSPQLTVLQRAGKFLRDNPFTRFSLILCAIVLCLSVGIDFYNRAKKRRIPEVMVYPPRVGHYTVKRPAEINAIEQRLRTLKRRGCSILYIEGMSGAGKTELVYQFVQHFVSKSSKWLGLRSVKPTVLYMNGTSEGLLEVSMREAAFGLGLKEHDFNAVDQSDPTVCTRVATLASALHSKLTNNKLPWLIVVDNLSGETLPSFVAAFVRDQWDWGEGNMIVTTRDTPPSNCSPENRIHIEPRVSPNVALELLNKLGDLSESDSEASRLLELLQYCPLAVALAASTIKLYSSCMPTVEGNDSPLAVYRDILNHSLSVSASCDEVLHTTVSLYLEAASTDPHARHTFDLMGSCDLEYPIPIPLITRHLANPFYKLSDYTPVDSPPPEPSNELTGGILSTSSSYLSQFKNMLPFGKSATSLPPPLPPEEESVPFLRNSPLLSFRKYSKTGFEVVHVHPSAHSELPLGFSKHTVQKLQEGHLSEAEELFNRRAWFRQYRTFNPKRSQEDYLRSLPGVSALGVLTHDQFQKSCPTVILSASGTRSSGGELEYSEYLHLVSHYHRVVCAMLAELKLAGGDPCDALLRKYLQPHLKAIIQFPLLSEIDKLSCSYSLVSIEAAFSKNSRELLHKFESLIAEQRNILGSQHAAVARTLTDMADLKYSLNDVLGAKELLESALHIYEHLSPKQADASHHLDLGLTLSSMGIVYSSLGEKERCRDILERALEVYQTIPPDGNITPRQRKRVATTLTDIAHAYLSLGDVDTAKKYIDLAILAQRSMYTDAHTEVIRTLNVMSIVYSLLGDKAESQKVRAEAGKLQNQINTQPLFL